MIAVSRPCLLPELSRTDLSIRAQVYHFNEIYCASLLSMRSLCMDRQAELYYRYVFRCFQVFSDLFSGVHLPPVIFSELDINLETST